MLDKIKKCLPYLQRAIAALSAASLGITIAFVLIWTLIVNYDDPSNFVRGAAYGGLTGVILFGLRYAEQCWKQVVSIFNYIADNSSASNLKSERIKGWSFQLKAGISSFFIAAPIFLAILLTPNAVTEQSSTEFIYIWAVEEPDATPNPAYTLHAPYLVFKPGALSQHGWENQAETWQEVDSGWFEQLSLQLSDRQRRDLKNHLFSLQHSCRASNQPIKIESLGFASEAPFLDRDRNRRPDSEQLNLAIANLRAQHVASTIDDLVSTIEFSAPKFEVSAIEWRHIKEMQQYRDEEFFQNLSISFSPHTDHRSVALRLAMPPECQILPSDQGTKMLAVRD